MQSAEHHLFDIYNVHLLIPPDYRHNKELSQKIKPREDFVLYIFSVEKWHANTKPEMNFLLLRLC